MRRKPIDQLSILLSLMLLSLLFACDKNEDKDQAIVEAQVTVLPVKGATTTIFNFDAHATLDPGTSEVPIFVRWDWESDGTWDLSYSTKSEYLHRYYAPGNYSALMEASNIFGMKDTISIPINVVQGYSPPKPSFTASPDSSNILTSFLFDASATFDDEDSLNTLQFRWDFDGNSIWDTDFSYETTIEKQYSVPARYNVRLEVKDPSELSDTVEVPIIVNLFDDRIHALFSYDCNHCTIEDIIKFDASESYHEDQSKTLTYSWDFRDDGIWDIENFSDPEVVGLIENIGANPVRLRVIDESGLMMDYVDTVHLYGINSEPIARITLSSHVGNTNSEFYLHSKASYDRDESIIDLNYYWDIDNDGEWDNQYDNLWEINIGLSTPGKHAVTLGIRDSGDKWGIAVDTIEIFEGNHETGYILDKRRDFRGDLYGTVKIGEQWWMQENLRYHNGAIRPPIVLNYYQNNLVYFEKFGALYFPRDLYNTNGLCPNGWRVPGLKDFEILFEHLEDNITSKIIYGGESEFHMKLGGWIEVDKIFKGYPVRTNLWTNDRNIQGNLPIGIFINTQPTETRSVYVNDHCAYYVRCIKE